MTKELTSTIDLLKSAKSPIIILPNNQSADILGSGLALFDLTKKLGKNVKIFSPNFQLLEKFSFIPEVKAISSDLKTVSNYSLTLDIDGDDIPDIKYQVVDGKIKIDILSPNSEIKVGQPFLHSNEFSHDLIISLGLSNLRDLGEIFEKEKDFFDKTPIINIDRQSENSAFGQINILNFKASSLSEIVYDLIQYFSEITIDEKLATYLLAGMIETTKSFKSPNTNARSLFIAGNLVDKGAQREKIVQELYGRQTIGSMKLWGQILLKLQTFYNDRIAMAVIDQSDFQETSTTSADLPALIDELIVSVPTVEFTVFFFSENGNDYCLIKTEKDLNLKNHFEFAKTSTNNRLLIFEYRNEKQEIIDKLATL